MAELRFEHHMSDEDALMWNIEKDPILRSTIVAVGMLDRSPDWDRLRARFERVSLIVPRLRQRALVPPLRIGPPRWAVEPDFDLDFHMRRYSVPAPGTQRQLLDAVAPAAQESFDRARPLWKCLVLEGLEGDRAALVLKVHHSVTDGVGGIEILTELVDLEREAQEPEDRPAAPAAEDLGRGALVRESLGHTSRRWMGIGSKVPGTLLRGALRTVRDPLGTALEAGQTIGSIGRALAPVSAPLSPIMVERSLNRRLDTLDVPLDDLKRAAKAAEGSINDAFVAAVVGGLARYHRRHDTEVDELRMTMPINLRTPGDTKAGNRFAPARFPVPIAIDDPIDRMREIGGLVRSQRAEPAIQMTEALAGILNRLPTTTVTALFGSMLKCIDFITTNVPGSPFPVYIGGAKVERFYAFAPPSGSAVNVALLSHVDTCCIGVVTDTAAIPDHEVLLDCLIDGFAEITALG